MKHNKKRNIGIIYELFLRHMSKCIVENNKSGLKTSTNIVSKRFNKKSEIYKEFRAFNALNKTKLTNKESAFDLLKETKSIIQDINKEKIAKEKSSLIRDINYKINNSSFYYSRLSNYKELGLIQTLINEWKKGKNANITFEKELEEKVLNIILQEKNNFNKNPLLIEDKIETSNIVINLMTEKINNKYKNMNSIQKDIIKHYGLYNTSPEKLENYLHEIKQNCIQKLVEFEQNNDNDYLSNKISEVKEKIVNLDCKEQNDNNIIKFLTVTDLMSELNSKE